MAQQWLDENYENNKDVDQLNLSGNNLQGHLDLRDFVNLEVFTCSDNQLTSLDCSNNDQLKRVNCSNNQLNSIILPNDSHKLEYLNLNNNLFNQDLSFLSRFVKLENLVLANNQFTGSLKLLW